MPQQINLCEPILLAPQRVFSAKTMLQALLFVGVSGALACAVSVRSLAQADLGWLNLQTAQSQELAQLQTALKSGQTGVVGAQAALSQALLAWRAELAQREHILLALQQGMFEPGWGHSAQLQLIANSVPSQLWVTQVKADDKQLEVSGFTLDPAALNDWMHQLARNPLLDSQTPVVLKVEAVNPIQSKAVWSFSLLSALGKPRAVTERAR